MQNVRLCGAWLLAGVSLGALAFLFVTGPPFAVKAEESKRFQYMIVEVLTDTQNMQTKLNEFCANWRELVAVPMGSMTESRLIFKK
jgi:hypothetical protein